MFYLEGFGGLVAYPQYDGGEGLNVTAMLLPPGEQINHTMIPMLHWQSGLFGRGTQNLVLRNQLSGALATLDRRSAMARREASLSHLLRDGDRQAPVGRLMVTRRPSWRFPEWCQPGFR